MSGTTVVSELYRQVTAAIIYAEALDDQGSSEAKRAYREVARLESAIAELIPAGTVEGDIARRGAVRASRLGQESAP